MTVAMSKHYVKVILSPSGAKQGHEKAERIIVVWEHVFPVIFLSQEYSELWRL
jgi:hypothetical protein